jgi:hypothetical protein
MNLRKSVSIWVTAGAAVLIWTVTPAAAQGRVPDTGMNAFGITLGASMPNEDSLENGLDLGVQFEHYLSPRLSVRGKLSGPWFDIQDRGFTGTVHPIAIEGNVVHNWERGVWHPYATAGIGLYRYGFDEGDLESSDTKFGINLGGGAEYFVTQRDALLGELQIRIVPGKTESLRTEYDTGYWTLGVGYKKYF